MAWFSFTGSDPVTPSDYTLNPSPSCAGANKICAIQADADSNNHPEITDSLKDEMIRALNSRASSTNVTLKA